MDYTRVVKEYRRCACALQFFMIGCVLVYLAQRSLEIISSAEDPPVDVSTEALKHFGEWAVCAHPNPPTSGRAIDSIGVGIPETYTGAEDLLWLLEQQPLSAKSTQLVSQVKRQIIPFSGFELNCVVVDLLNADLRIPSTASICTQPLPFTIDWLMLNSETGWRYVTELRSDEYPMVRYSVAKHGWSSGFTSQASQILTTSVTVRESGGEAPCIWRHFTGSPPSLGKPVAATILFKDPVVMVTLTRGIFPQFFDLFTGMGGFLSMTTLVFAAVFVKRFPQSDVAVVFEQRTLFGNQATGNPDSSVDDAVEEERQENQVHDKMEMVSM
ncbi:ftsH [Symbiodinium microadriaticum]|nr:ftsH [Symbiodinium microadriaticum]CAE7945513.1 ftsH [Symbiodinium sp. KB8]